MTLESITLSKFRMKIPPESFLFFAPHIWLVISVFLQITVRVLNIGSEVIIFVLVAALLLCTLLAIPTLTITHNIATSIKDYQKVLCCIPLLLISLIVAVVTILESASIIYEMFPNSNFRTYLLFKSLADITIHPVIAEIEHRGFPYTQLPKTAFYIAVLPISLFVYLLPSIRYNKELITKEMELIILLPLFFFLIPMTVYIASIDSGPLDSMMTVYEWAVILTIIRLLSFGLLMPILGILYIRHHNRVI